MAIGFVKDLSALRDRSPKCSAGTADGHSFRKRAERPSEATPKGGTHVLAVCAAPGQLEYFVALVLQQYGQQTALCDGRG